MATYLLGTRAKKGSWVGDVEQAPSLDVTVNMLPGKSSLAKVLLVHGGKEIGLLSEWRCSRSVASSPTQ